MALGQRTERSRHCSFMGSFATGHLGAGKNPNRPHFKSVSCGFKHSFRPFICVTLLSPHPTLLSPLYTLKLRLKKMKAFA